MRRLHTWLVTGAVAGFLLSACDSKLEDETRLLELIRPKIEVTSVDEGAVTLAERGVWRSYAVRVTNHFTQPIYIAAISNPKILSSYTTDRNPLGYCYYVMKQTADGKWKDGDMGLHGTSTVRHAIAPGQSIEFKAPVRIQERPMDDAVALRPRITVYCSEDDRNGTHVDATSPNPIPK